MGRNLNASQKRSLYYSLAGLLPVGGRANRGEQMHGMIVGGSWRGSRGEKKREEKTKEF